MKLLLPALRIIHKGLLRYWALLKKTAVFSSGYVAGGIVVGVLSQAPALAWHVLAVIP